MMLAKPIHLSRHQFTFVVHAGLKAATLESLSQVLDDRASAAPAFNQSELSVLKKLKGLAELSF